MWQPTRARRHQQKREVSSYSLSPFSTVQERIAEDKIALPSFVFPNVFISLYINDSIKLKILTFKRPQGTDMDYYPLSICNSKHSYDFCACHQLVCCIWLIQPWLEIVIYSHTFGNSLTSFQQFPFQSCLTRWGCGLSSDRVSSTLILPAPPMSLSGFPFCRKAFKKEKRKGKKRTQRCIIRSHHFRKTD